MPDSPFLKLPPSAWITSNELAFAIRDAYPVSPGHTLVVPRRQVATWFDATIAEQHAILALVDEVRRELDAELHPDGYNVGFNAGTAAGQTVDHLHVHVIPRFHGDMTDPRGGVRHVIPDRGNYLLGMRHSLVTGGSDPLGWHILPLLERSEVVAIVAAFVQQSGLRRIEPAVAESLRGGSHVRILTGDYLNITQVEALETLLDWQSTWAGPGGGEADGVSADPGKLEVRVMEVGRPGRPTSFHPKSWRFERSGSFAVAFVGSSNLSRQALGDGVEWNLRIDRDREPAAYHRVVAAYEALWASSSVLDAAWVADYARRVRTFGSPLPTGEVDAAPLPPADPHLVQREALAKLQQARDEGRRRALVVLATGLGKTWLAAFDYRQMWDVLGRPPRLLFLAHRREILRQAAQTYRRLLHDRGVSLRIGWFLEDQGDLGAPLVFAAVQKLSRAEHLAKLDPRQFDYVVVDEVHHAAADSYRRVLNRLDPGFLLGLTATPDRTDTADILGLFDDFVAYRADIAQGIAIRRLVPFHYFGVRDDVDYANVPWRNHRFDPAALAEAVQTEARMRTLWTAWTAHPGARTLVFCCSIEHALFVRDWLRARHVKVAAVFADPRSDDREAALHHLETGEIDAVCAVDVFNEGVDVPALDRVIMLRPTESGVVFLQQLGRGLRAADGKEALTIVDFVGNHRVFLDRLRTLLSLGSDRPGDLAKLLDRGELALPAGCSVEIELEAKRLLESLFNVRGVDNVERAYRELKVARDRRPTAGEMYRIGFHPARLRPRHGSWFHWLRSEHDLTGPEERAFERASQLLDDLEHAERMQASFKMITLEVLVEADALGAGVPVRDLALRSWQLLSRDPGLLREVPLAHRLPEDPSEAAIRAWVSYWRGNPVNAWTGTRKRQKTWFRVTDDDRLALNLDVDPALTGLIAELVDYRLAKHRLPTTSEGFRCTVFWNQHDPILKLPSPRPPDLAQGDVDVRLPDGGVWQFRFAKIACNVAHPVGTLANQLPDLLRRWFGPTAGQPGTAFEVRFIAGPDGLGIEPVRDNVVAFMPRHAITAWPDLRAAAGHILGDTVELDPERVWLPLDGADPDLFAVRVAGTSMDGGKAPLRDGDWAVFRHARHASADAVQDRVVLVQVPGATGGNAWQIKRVRSTSQGWQLTSDNPAGPTFEADEHMTVVARLDRAVRPEDLAPPIHTVSSVDALADRFGIEELPARSGYAGGHRFVFLDRKGMLVAPDRVRLAESRRPGETIYVLAPVEGGFRYLGVGRWREDSWVIPEVDYSTWKAWGEGRAVSRRLPDGALGRAQQVADALLALPDDQRILERGDGTVRRILGPAQRGGFRLDGEGGSDRTISLLDLAWVAVAADDVTAHGGVLDEARVNRFRFLEGTPAGSTRWIDTGWALAAWARAAS